MLHPLSRPRKTQMKGTEQQWGNQSLRLAITGVGRMSPDNIDSKLVAGAPQWPGGWLLWGCGSVLLLTGLLGSIAGRIREYSQQLVLTESLLCVSQYPKHLRGIFSFNLSNNVMKLFLLIHENRFREIK